MVQIMGQPQGLKSSPNVDLSGLKDVASTIASFIMLKKQKQKEEAANKLELWMKESELTGSLSKPTADIQKAFKTKYKTEPMGLFAEGGETLAGKKAKGEIAKTAAEATKAVNMADWYAKRGTGATGNKALDYAVKFANGKLGKPFAVLEEDERALWQQYHDEGLEQYVSMYGGAGDSKKKDYGKYSTAQIGWLNRYNAKSDTWKQKILANPEKKKVLLQELKQLGLSEGDL